MGLEIERRFLVKPDWRPTTPPTRLDQGRYYFGEDARGTVEHAFGVPLFHLRPIHRGSSLMTVPLNWVDAWSLTVSGERFRPGFFGWKTDLPPGWMARIRAYDRTDFVMDIKGPREGTTRQEFGEYPLAPEIGRVLLDGTPPSSHLSKLRYTVPYRGHDWVVDVYQGGKSHHLPTCEVELPSADTPLDLPDWVGEEITHRKTFTR